MAAEVSRIRLVQFLVLFIVGIQPTQSINCYSCLPYHSGSEYPKCLQHHTTCAQGHVCTIFYKPGVALSSYLVMGCASSCVDYDAHDSNRCDQGGKLTSFNACVKCCTANTCVNRFKRSVLETSTTTPTTTTTIAPTNSALYCPIKCSTSLPAVCRMRACDSNTHYCNLVLNLGTTDIEGTCSLKSLERICQSYNSAHHCPFRVQDAHLYFSQNRNLQGYCYYGCCETNSCIQQILFPAQQSITRSTLPTTSASTLQTRPSSSSSTTSSTTTTKATRSMPPTTIPTRPPGTKLPVTIPTFDTSTFNYSSLATSCVDKLQGQTCSVLRDTKAICTAPIGTALCAQTCNICKMLKAVRCEDKSVTNDCAALSAKPGFCQDDMAIYICPKSCDLCNLLIKDMVDEVLAASPIPDFNQPLTTHATLHCKELLQSKCEHVRDVCGHSNLRQVCPHECQICS